MVLPKSIFVHGSIHNRKLKKSIKKEPSTQEGDGSFLVTKVYASELGVVVLVWLGVTTTG